MIKKIAFKSLLFIPALSFTLIPMTFRAEELNTESPVEEYVMPDTLWTIAETPVYDNIGGNEIVRLNKYDKVSFISVTEDNDYYKIETEDGIAGFVYKAMLNDNNPRSQSFSIYNENDGQVYTYTIEDADPFAIEALKEDLIAESKKPIDETGQSDTADIASDYSIDYESPSEDVSNELVFVETKDIVSDNVNQQMDTILIVYIAIIIVCLLIFAAIGFVRAKNAD